MKYAILALTMLLVSGAAAGQQPTKRPPDAEVLAGLRFEAHKHHLRWEVFCVPTMPKRHYQAAAIPVGVPQGAEYIEDGAKDWWAATGDTAIEAAYALYLMLANDKPPTQRPEHHPRKDDECTYNIVYDSEHAGKIPCKSDAATKP
jgi:hypothetical protein